MSAPRASDPPPPTARSRGIALLLASPWFAAGTLTLATAAAYANSLTGPFIFDDVASIIGNPSIHSLWHAWVPPATGMPVSGRPMVNVSLALNHALGGTDVRGYHAFNIGLHLLAGLALFGVVRRTLRWRNDRDISGPAAFAAALWWLLHPLQTESVSYIVQRAEALAGLFLLVTLYAFIRSVDAPHPPRWRWSAVAVAACFAGMASKEVMAATPLIVLLYDRTFVSGTFRRAWHQRRALYAALASSWLLLAWLVATGAGRGGTAGFDAGISPWDYLATQCRAIVHYLRLVVWPHPLVFDHGAGVVRNMTDVWWQFVVLLALAVATVVAVWRRSPIGFCGACFFAILAPSSSIVPVTTQTMAEHRMYLPLAAIIVPLAVLVHARGRPAVAWLTCVIVAAALGVRTHARNGDYRSELAIWRRTAQDAPHNARAHYNLARALAALGDHAAARSGFAQALRVDPTYGMAHEGLANALAATGEFDAAFAEYERALALAPGFSAAHLNYGAALERAGRLVEATSHYETAVGLEPDAADAHYNLARIYTHAGRTVEAIARFTDARRLAPPSSELHRLATHGLAGAHVTLGLSLARAGRLAEATPHFESAVKADPGLAAAHANLGNVCLQAGRFAEAIAQYEEAARLDPQLPGVQENLALAREALRRSDR